MITYFSTYIPRSYLHYITIETLYVGHQWYIVSFVYLVEKPRQKMKNRDLLYYIYMIVIVLLMLDINYIESFQSSLQSHSVQFHVSEVNVPLTHLRWEDTTGCKACNWPLLRTNRYRFTIYLVYKFIPWNTRKETSFAIALKYRTFCKKDSFDRTLNYRFTFTQPCPERVLIR